MGDLKEITWNTPLRRWEREQINKTIDENPDGPAEQWLMVLLKIYDHKTA